jgi:hypothetical protein
VLIGTRHLPDRPRVLRPIADRHCVATMFGIRPAKLGAAQVITGRH